MARIDLVDLATAMTGDEAGRLTRDDADRAVSLALLRYSSDRPRTATAMMELDENGRGAAFPRGWDYGESRILEVKTPGDNILEPSAWELAETQEGWELHVRLPMPYVFIRHTAAHTADSVPGQDQESVAHWAAALLLDQLASLYSGDKQSTIDADAVDHQGKGGAYAARAAEHRKLYLDHLGVDPKRTVAAGTVLAIGGGGLLHARPRKRPIR